MRRESSESRRGAGRGLCGTTGNAGGAFSSGCIDEADGGREFLEPFGEV